MRTTPKIKRVQLKVNQNKEPVLIGIVSSEPDYKLSLALNRKLKIALRHSTPLVIPDNSSRELTFSRFSDSSSTSEIIYDLIANRSGKTYLFKKLKNIDYIFQVHNHDNEDITDFYITKLRDTEYITAVFNLDSRLLKDKNLQFVTH
jgi:hypothetical protein